MKIRNAINSDHDSRALSGAVTVRSEDIAFIQELAQRTVVPRHFVIEKLDEQFEFIVQRKQLVAFKTTQEFQYVDPTADLVAQNEAVITFVNSFGTLSDDDELTIQRVDPDLLEKLPSSGVDLDNIDFSVDVIAPAVTPTGHTLRIVVDNQRDEVEIPAMIAPVETTAPVIEDAPTNVTGAVRKFYKHMRVHANYTVLKSREGETLDSYGILPDFNASILSGLVEDFGTFNKTTSRDFGTAPMMISMVSQRQENIAMIYVISGERMLIAEIPTTKLGRIMMDWNSLLATKASND